MSMKTGLPQTDPEVCGRDGIVPPMVADIAGRIDSPFFSVDIVLNRDGVPRLIELRDGQVSDRKKWPVETFTRMLKTPLTFVDIDKGK
jgi:hypothetical protein